MLFARTPKQEALAKGLGREAALFEFARGRVGAAVASLEGVDLFVPDQGAGGFGEKLAQAFRQARALGYDQVVAVPIDAPALTAGDLAGAFEELRTHEAVLGPSPDGGVYLLGLRGQGVPESRFGEVRWLTRAVATDLLRCFPAAAVLTRVIADVDRRADLGRLAHDAALDPQLAAILFALLAPSLTEYPDTTIPSRMPPAGRRRGRAPPAPQSCN